ncbi:biopolymer transporter ExbD [Spirulina sp. CS-785/01]|uniref:ExbD/TolR family protein n=1 Tax=Spirulina sp. CS-785/01 TaxID=3021716 RepID=UPI002330318E|nr:biopolymer transporter ExbD [Spirulina sp. CS-785/01]MDB9314400.1 biopolymer transporter ExbD [Spirulina sp. CS-785/01]
MPKMDLIPMLNVMVAVLAFFVMVSMTLTPQSDTLDVELPQPQTTDSPTPDLPETSLMVRLTEQETLQINQQTYSQDALLNGIATYLQINPEGTVFLVADPQVSYEKVMQTLSAMREVGKERVSLGIQPSPLGEMGR